MRIESNIAQVIGKLERIKAAVPVAISAALAPTRWREPARIMAEQTLLSLAKPEERVYIPGFIQTVSALLLDSTGGLALRMTANLNLPGAARLSLAEAQVLGGVTRNKDKGMGLFDLPYQDFRNLIQQWVETPESEGGKKRDARDTGKTDEDIARLISYIMLSPDVQPGSQGAAARDALTPHIQTFLTSLQPPSLPPETVDLWLRTVLAVWREMIRMHLPGAIKRELRAVVQ